MRRGGCELREYLCELGKLKGGGGVVALARCGCLLCAPLRLMRRQTGPQSRELDCSY